MSEIAGEQRHRPTQVANLIEEGRWGGPQKRIALVATALKAHTVETTVLLPERDSERFRNVLNEAGVAWKTFPLHRLGRERRTLLIYVLTFLNDTYCIWRALRQGSYDLLHVSGGVWQFKGPIAGRLAGVPVIWHLNDTQMSRAFIVLFRWLGKCVDGFFVAANRVQKYYLDGTSLETIPAYLIPAPVVTDDYSRQSVSTNESIDAKVFPRIVTVSNINPIKGLLTLIEASALIKFRLDTFSVSIIGALHSNQNSYFKMLNKLIAKHNLEENVFFMGECQHVSGILKSADIYVCSSFAEASPMAVWEAMSMGCAIVSTDVGDVSEYIKDGENGFIVPVGDEQSMANAICKLVEDQTLRYEFGRKAREVACRELDLSIVAEMTAKGYKAVLAAHKELD
ncbi:conserved hypothetical protein [Gammaproteobacteria bacterium]